jgi:hypothetical protein
MVDRKELPAVRLVVGATLAAYVAGEHLEFSKAPAKQAITMMLGTTSNTSVASVVTFNPTTFAQIEPPPPIVPAGDRKQQG